MENHGHHAAFYQEVFAAAVSADCSEDGKVTANKTEAEVDEKKTVQNEAREDFLKVINYPSPNYESRRRASFPTFASVTSFL